MRVMGRGTNCTKRQKKIRERRERGDDDGNPEKILRKHREMEVGNNSGSGIQEWRNEPGYEKNTSTNKPD